MDENESQRRKKGRKWCREWLEAQLKTFYSAIIKKSVDYTRCIEKQIDYI
jgi:hypothetical protein